jgi:hypothetical protein
MASKASWAVSISRLSAGFFVLFGSCSSDEKTAMPPITAAGTGPSSGGRVQHRGHWYRRYDDHWERRFNDVAPRWNWRRCFRR